MPSARGALEIVDDGVTGYLTADDGVAVALEKVAELDHPACRGSVERRFSAERIVGDHFRVCERVAGNGGPRR
jgi:hypothetical protein